MSRVSIFPERLYVSLLLDLSGSNWKRPVEASDLGLVLQNDLRVGLLPVRLRREERETLLSQLPSN